MRVEGQAYTTQEPGTVPLWSWGGAEREDALAATDVGAAAAAGAGYRQVRIEGYVFAAQAPGTMPLNNWWNPDRGDNFQTATAAGDTDARGSGYGFAWTEGYVLPP